MFLKTDQKGNEADFWCVADVTEATESIGSGSPVTTAVLYGPCSSSLWPVLTVAVVFALDDREAGSALRCFSAR